MTITLTLSVLPDGGTTLTGFTQFWLRYVRGFSPQYHCQRSLRGFNDPRFSRHMQLGQSVALLEPVRYQHIYLCGVTARRYPGLHLALLPDASEQAHAVTYNGIKISVRGARRLEIPALPEGYAGMPHSYTSCINWQFGVCYYGSRPVNR
ncbi:MAG: hypothetical protein ACM3MF_03320 [Anaerolineae bacterium]